MRKHLSQFLRRPLSNKRFTWDYYNVILLRAVLKLNIAQCNKMTAPTLRTSKEPMKKAIINPGQPKRNQLTCSQGLRGDIKQYQSKRAMKMCNKFKHPVTRDQIKALFEGKIELKSKVLDSSDTERQEEPQKTMKDRKSRQKKVTCNNCVSQEQLLEKYV